MNKAILAVAAGLVTAFTQPVVLKGHSADAFISTHFPNAVIPGDVTGKFAYDRHGRKRVGHAKCNVPAMGARSDGAVSTCTVWY
jgi:hypothetical protein